MERLTHQGEHGPYWDKAVFDKHGGMEEDLIIDRLAYYEDMEEQGRLKILPFAVGDTVYQIKRMTNAESKRAGVKPDYEGLYGGERNRVVFTPNRPYKIVKREATKSMVNGFGKTVFLTREEAEQALKGGAN